MTPFSIKSIIFLFMLIIEFYWKIVLLKSKMRLWELLKILSLRIQPHFILHFNEYFEFLHAMFLLSNNAKIYRNRFLLGPKTYHQRRAKL